VERRSFGAPFARRGQTAFSVTRLFSAHHPWQDTAPAFYIVLVNRQGGAPPQNQRQPDC
jgi:hypothetical protein